MKNFVFALFLFSCLTLLAQKEIVLRLNHTLNSSTFSYNDNFLLDGKQNRYTRLQYYLSGFELEHDAGQLTPLTNTYVLASGHINNYYLGNYNISSVESISFDVGVDANANGGNTTNYSAQHPLGPKSPPMDWGWPSGYFFVVANGLNDADNDNTPETIFQLNALGNQMLTQIDPININPINSNDTIYIDLKVNAEKFLSEINLSTAGIDHSSSATNFIMCNNAYTMNVFESYTSTNNVIQNSDLNNFIFIDYTLPFAPTINYHFDSNKKTNLTITDINGRVHTKEINLQNEGSYFPIKEFSTGIYIVSIDNGEHMIHKKFNVVQ
ncbi:MAG: hypothetical protein CND37_01695 [Bacteroidetes bacterium MED-G20]|nr:MAG: hypothetical protein CND37_01695 [Bacteroidetes bacterium MED-G20]